MIIKQKRVLAAFVGAAMLVAGSACSSKAEQQAEDGLEAFRRCDVAGAHEAFAAAYAADTRPNFAFAFALSDLATLIDDPAMQALAPRLGFSSPPRSQALWGPNGVVSQGARLTETCDALETSFRSAIPHPSAQKAGPNVEDTLDPSLTFTQLVDGLRTLDARFARLVQALEQASTASQDFRLKGGCGLGAMDLQRTDLLLLAAAMEFVRAVMQLGRAYDGEIPVELLWRQATASSTMTQEKRQTLTDAYNAHLLRVRDKQALLESKPLLAHALDLASRAAVAIEQAGPRPAQGLVAWSAFPKQILIWIKAYLEFGQSALRADEQTSSEIPYLDPSLLINVASFFTRPFDLSTRPGVWKLETNGAIITDEMSLKNELRTHFSPNPFASDAPEFTSELEDQKKAWDNTDWAPIFDPDKRWSMAYTCK